MVCRANGNAAPDGGESHASADNSDTPCKQVHKQMGLSATLAPPRMPRTGSEGLSTILENSTNTLAKVKQITEESGGKVASFGEVGDLNDGSSSYASKSEKSHKSQKSLKQNA